MKKTVRRKEWDKPVSMRAYQKISDKALCLLKDFGVGTLTWQACVMQLIDTYLLHGIQPAKRECDFYVFIVFKCLKYDVDAARVRSEAARRQAAARRERRAAEKAQAASSAACICADSATAEGARLSSAACICSDSAIKTDAKLSPAVCSCADSATVEGARLSADGLESQLDCDGAGVGVGDDKLRVAVEGGDGECAGGGPGGGPLDAAEGGVAVACPKQTDSAIPLSVSSGV